MKNNKPSKKIQSSCDICAYYDYDEFYGDYVCSAFMDEDETARFYGAKHESCPYFRFYDEYKIVRKQN